MSSRIVDPFVSVFDHSQRGPWILPPFVNLRIHFSLIVPHEHPLFGSHSSTLLDFRSMEGFGLAPSSSIGKEVDPIDLLPILFSFRNHRKAMQIGPRNSPIAYHGVFLFFLIP